MMKIKLYHLSLACIGSGKVMLAGRLRFGQIGAGDFGGSSSFVYKYPNLLITNPTTSMITW